MLDGAILRDVLQAPSVHSLRALQTGLLALEERSTPGSERDAAQAALACAEDFHSYLVALEGRLEAQSFAELASRMDIAAVGGVVLDNLLLADGARFTERILLGGLSEGLKVLASRQYVNAFRRELVALYREVAWKLRTHIWRFAARGRAGMDPAERARLVDALLGPIWSETTPDTARSVLIGLLFQVLLLGTVGPLLEGAER